jgi:hypothetical protein
MLAEQGIELVSWDQLEAPDRAALSAVFADGIFPVLTPLAVDPGHPFPYISNLSLNLAVLVHAPARGETRFARVKIPPLLLQPLNELLEITFHFIPKSTRLLHIGNQRLGLPALWWLMRHGITQLPTPNWKGNCAHPMVAGLAQLVYRKLLDRQ